MLRKAAVATLVIGALVLLPIPSATAHAELTSSTPSAGEALVDRPGEVSLTFSLDLVDAGAVVVVSDETGRDWVDGEPEVAGSVLTADLSPSLPEAEYEVRWRVVSSDGHSSDGTYSFTVGQPSDGDETSSSGSADGGPVRFDVDADRGQAGSATLVPFAVALMAVGGSGIVAVIWWSRRRGA